jgi:hypothetical protein
MKSEMYVVVTGEGNELTFASEHNVEAVAQFYADKLGETVYYGLVGGGDLDPDDDEDIGVAVEPRGEEIK